MVLFFIRDDQVRLDKFILKPYLRDTKGSKEFYIAVGD